MKATIYKINGMSIEIENIKRFSLDEIQSIIEGQIEVVILSFMIKNKIVKKTLILNENGIYLNLFENPHSQKITKNSNWYGSSFLGNVILCEGVY